MAEAGRSEEAAGAFGGFIGPRTLRALVESTAPYLFSGSFEALPERPVAKAGRLADLAAGPYGWWACLLGAERLEATEHPNPERWTDYFALCLAAHFASVMTFVPTDVDSKIRRNLWKRRIPEPEFERMTELALGLESWDIRPVSRRYVDCGDLGIVSGHDGERLSVLLGALSAAAAADRGGAVDRLGLAVDRELARQAAAFDRATEQCRFEGRGSTRSGERDWLILAAILTHNAGDVDQGLGQRDADAAPDRFRERFGELSRARLDRYGGAFGRAAAIYRETLAPEGHRNYPLRAVKALRRSPEFLLVPAPFLDDWGAGLAGHRSLKPEDRGEVVDALVQGCRRTPGQSGYYRALAGFGRAVAGGLDGREVERHVAASTRRDLKEAEFRKKLAIRRESFESSLVKRARAAHAAASKGR